MYIYFTFYSIFLFIPIICGNNTSSSPSVSDTKVKVISNKTTTVEAHTSVFNKTKVEMLSEGGYVLPALPILPSMTLPKENHTNLLGLDKELGKTKEKPVVGRKGVVYNPLEDPAKADIHSDRVDTSVPKTPIANDTGKILAPVNNATKVVFPVNNSTTPITSVDVMHNVTESTTKIPKKPLILSYEALSAMGKKSEIAQSHKIESSSKSEVTDQLPTPNVKIQMTTNRHPGMVMPIVITMLVVPMFAVLGYMALRRGQEAWKNRHYKRMDFLLDGMYND